MGKCKQSLCEMMRSPTVAVIIDVFNAFFSLAQMEPNKQTIVCGLSGIAFLLIAPIYVCHEKFANLDKNSPLFYFGDEDNNFQTGGRSQRMKSFITGQYNVVLQWFVCSLSNKYGLRASNSSFHRSFREKDESKDVIETNDQASPITLHYDV